MANVCSRLLQRHSCMALPRGTHAVHLLARRSRNCTHSTLRSLASTLVHSKSKTNKCSGALDSSSCLRLNSASRRRLKATISSGDVRFRNFRQSLEELLLKPRTIPIPRWITPRHSTITLSEIFGHASFVLVASSYAVDDFLTLRIVAVVGSAVMLVFTYFHPHGRVLWLPFKWNCLFIAINSYRIGKVFWYRYQAGRLPPDITSLYRKNFYLMDPVDFFSLVSIAKIEEFKADDVIIRQGQLNGRVFLVVDGALSVLRDGKLVYRLEEANFVSEAGLHTGLALPGEVEATCSVIADLDGRLLTWQRTDLVELMDRSPGLMRSFKATLSWDVIHKLKAQRVLITSGQIEDTEEWTERRKQQTQYRYTAIMKNILGESSHANLLEEKRKELNKYRTIHLISDEVHEKALHECGWTVEEFENGKKKEWEQIGWGEWDRLLHRIDTFIHRFLN